MRISDWSSDVCSSDLSMADVMPTICEAMGAEIPPGVQGRSLLPLLKGEDFPAEEFRSITAQVGVGGLYYDEKDDIPVTVSRGEGGHWDELNGITQSGNAQMVRMGDWKLRSEEHTSELQSLMRTSYAVFCLQT